MIRLGAGLIGLWLLVRYGPLGEALTLLERVAVAVAVE